MKFQSDLPIKNIIQKLAQMAIIIKVGRLRYDKMIQLMCLLECEFIKFLDPNVIYVCKSFALRWGATKGTRHWIENFFSLFPNPKRPKSCRKVVYVFKVDSTTIQYSLLCTSKFKYYAKKNSLSGSLLYEWIPLILQTVGLLLLHSKLT